MLAVLGQPTSTDPAEVAARASAFCAGLGLDVRLSAHGVPAGDLIDMAAEAHAIRRLLDNNPRDIGRDEIAAMYQRAF